MNKCLENIIGLSANASKCFKDKRPGEYDISDSGLYIDEHAGLQLTTSSTYNENVWSYLIKAKKNGLYKLDTDLDNLINSKLEEKRLPFHGFLGATASIHDTDQSKNYTVSMIQCSPIIGSYITIHSLGALFGSSGTETIELHDNVNGFIKNISVETIDDTLVETQINERLPMYNKLTDRLTYYFVHQNNGNIPLLVTTSCGCGNRETPLFNVDNPSYEIDDRTGEDSWMNYIIVGGAEVNSTSADLKLIEGKQRAETSGLTFTISINCVKSESLCSEGLDFEADTLAKNLARAAWYACGIAYTETLLNTRKLNEISSINYAMLDNNLLSYKKDYSYCLKKIKENIVVRPNDCMQCRDNSSFVSAGLMA